MKAIFWTVAMMGFVLLGISHFANYIGSMF
jgi:hypothetical protein